MICTDFDVHVASKFTSRGICSEVFVKERLLENSDLEGVALCWLPLCRFAIFQCRSVLLYHDQSAKADQSTVGQSRPVDVIGSEYQLATLLRPAVGVAGTARPAGPTEGTRFVGFVSSTFSWMVQVGHSE